MTDGPRATPDETAAPAATLSVVVPTLDEAATLPALLVSLQGAGAPDEVVVVDGGSADGTARVAERAGARWITARRGRGAQLRAGGEAAGGELLLFLHADARLAPGALTAVRSAFVDPTLAAAALRQAIDHPARFYRLVESVANARARRAWTYGDSGLCVRRDVYAAAGGFRELPLFEDVDLARRVRRLGRVALLERAVVHVSARRWEREGRLRRTLLNQVLTLGYLVGVPPRRLVRYYPDRADERRVPTHRIP